MRAPTLSVVVPNFNHAPYLARSLQAILDQSYPCAEVIVADDLSTDNSVEVVETFARKDSRVRLLRNERNLGVNENVRRLVAAASGDYVYPPAADDFVLPGFFEKSMRMLIENPAAGLSSALVRLVDADGNDTGMYLGRRVCDRPRYFEPGECLRLLRKHSDWMPAVSTIFKRRALLEAGSYRAELGVFADGLLQQVVALRCGVCYSPEMLTCFRQTSSSWSATEVVQIDEYLERLKHVTSLMRNEYRDVFPRDYVRRQEKVWLYWAGVNAGENLAKAHATYVQHLARSLVPNTAADRLLFALLSAATRLRLRMVQGYLFLRRRRMTLERLGARLGWLRARFKRWLPGVTRRCDRSEAANSDRMGSRP